MSVEIDSETEKKLQMMKEYADVNSIEQLIDGLIENYRNQPTRPITELSTDSAEKDDSPKRVVPDAWESDST